MSECMERPRTFFECLKQEIACAGEGCEHVFTRNDFLWHKSIICPDCGSKIFFRCPWVSCKNHMFLYVSDSTPLFREHLDPTEMKVTCWLDLEGEEWTMESIGEIFGISRQRIEQIEKAALEKQNKAMKRKGVDTFDDIVESNPRRVPDVCREHVWAKIEGEEHEQSGPVRHVDPSTYTPKEPRNVYLPDSLERFRKRFERMKRPLNVDMVRKNRKKKARKEQNI